MAPWIVGLGLSQIGEFSFVLARAGVTSGMLSKPTYDLALTCTVLTMALSPLVSSLACRWAARGVDGTDAGTPAAPVEPSTEPLRDHVIVAGYGRSGRAAARVLHRAGIPLVVVEINHSVYGGLASDGFSGIWGDVTGDEILKAARIDAARLLLLTVPDQTTVHLAVQRARSLNSGVSVIARAFRRQDVRRTPPPRRRGRGPARVRRRRRDGPPGAAAIHAGRGGRFGADFRNAGGILRAPAARVSAGRIGSRRP